MTGFGAALWAETLKARRSPVAWLASAGLLLLPAVGGLFMIILRDPNAARDMGLISAKAQLTAGSADWPSLFGILSQGLAVGGSIVFALITAWVFGREFSDRTAKELLAVPTGRGAVVAAKFVLVAVWVAGLAALVFVAGLGVGSALSLPGWSSDVAGAALGTLAVTTGLSILLLAWVAFFAGAGHGYLPPLGWAFLTTALAQIAVVMGWGDRFPWAVPALLSDLAGPSQGLLGPHSYALVAATGLLGLWATFTWWRRADHVR